MNTLYKLRDVERFTRFVIGFGIVMSILVLPLTAEQIIMAILLAFYPLITALVAIDPVFYILNSVKLDSIAFPKSQMETA